MRWMPVKVGSLVGAIFLLAGCSSGPDSRCSVANCEAFNNCEVVLPGQVQVGDALVCDNGGLPSMSQISSYCVMACEADGDGALLQCVATNFGASCQPTDSGPPNYRQIHSDIAATCLNSPACGSNCTSCQAACNSKRSACNLECPDAGVCLDCEYQCSQAYVSCQNVCPTN